MIRKSVVAAAILGLAFATAACGEDEEHHGDLMLTVTATPSPATVGSAVEIEVMCMDGTEHVLPNEVHVEFAEVGSTAAPTEVQATAHTDHFKLEHTFTTAGTYDVKAEAHIGGEHDEILEHTIQLVVQ